MKETGNGEPILQSETGVGIELLVACSDDAGTQGSVQTINLDIPESYRGNFSINTVKELPQVQVIQVKPEYDIVSSVEISFTMQVNSSTSKQG